MKISEKERIEKNRKETSIKSMYFNRYLLVRYITALFLFTNIYWFVLLLMSYSSFYFIPLILLITIAASLMEQVKIYSFHTNRAKYSQFCFTILFSTNLLLIVSTFFSTSFNQLYPFLTNQFESKVLILFILSIGVLLSIITLNRLYKIKNNKDKHYQRIKEYEKTFDL